jgi:hypothetical protein
MSIDSKMKTVKNSKSLPGVYSNGRKVCIYNNYYKDYLKRYGEKLVILTRCKSCGKLITIKRKKYYNLRFRFKKYWG